MVGLAEKQLLSPWIRIETMIISTNGMSTLGSFDLRECSARAFECSIGIFECSIAVFNCYDRNSIIIRQ